MEDIIYYNDLYDLYGCLLTDKQRMYFEDYYFNNLSLSEMSLNYNVSRNAVFKQIHIAVDKLIDFDKKMNLYNKRKKLEDIISNIDNLKLKRQIEELF